MINARLFLIQEQTFAHARGCLLTSLLLLISLTLHAQPYYVDANRGSDANAGTEASPFQTIQQAADVMASGDVCIIRGGTYRESVTPTADNLTFEAYPGETPILNGCDVVSGWTPHQGATYKTAAAKKVYAVFSGGERMQIARWPNEDGDPFSTDEWAANTVANTSTDGTGRATVTFSDNLPTGPWDGAFFTGFNGENFYQFNAGTVTSSTANQITIKDLNGTLRLAWPEFSGAGKGYIINHLSALDVATEWYWGEGQLYFRPPGGSAPGENVEARTRLYGFDLSDRSGITIKGIRFFASTVLMESTNESTVQECAFYYHAPWGNHREDMFDTLSGERGQYVHGNPVDGTGGIYISGNNNIIRSNYITKSWGTGVHIRGGNNNQIDNNIFEEVNWLGKSGTIFFNGRGNAITRNTIRNCANMGIIALQIGPVAVKQPKVMYNHISDVGKLLIDSGTSGIYLNNHNLPSAERTLEGGRFAYNYIGKINVVLDNGKGFGIYMDDGADGLTIDHNVINAGPGIRAPIFSNGNGHEVKDFFVYNNTIWNHPPADAPTTLIPPGGFVTQLNPNKQGNRVNVQAKNNLAQHLPFRKTYRQAGDVVAAGNLGDFPGSGFVNADGDNFQLAQGSPAINAGEVIAGITDGFEGSAPDVGAYEFGAEPWTAGSTLSGDPTQGGSTPTDPEPQPDPEPNPNPGNELTLTPTADAMLNSAAPTTNYGSNTSISVQQRDDRTLTSLLRFELTALNGRTITAARLLLQESDGGTALSNNSSVEVRLVSGEWNEAQVTWNDHPPYGEAPLGSLPANSVQENQRVEINLEASALPTSGPLDLALVGTSSGNDLGFYSKEGTTPPQLVLTLSHEDDQESAGELSLSRHLRAYPNPASEVLTVAGDNDYQVSLYDLMGRPVMQQHHLRDKATLDISHLRPGIYLLKVQDAQNTQVQQRIIIE